MGRREYREMLCHNIFTIFSKHIINSRFVKLVITGGQNNNFSDEVQIKTSNSLSPIICWENLFSKK